MNTYEWFIVIGMGLWIAVAIALLVVILRLLTLVGRARQPLDRMASGLEQMERRLEPALRHVDRIAINADDIVSHLKSDAEDVGDALRRASDSTHRMLDMVEDRVAEATALIAVVQEEAEETFLSTASLISGIRGGRKTSRVAKLRRALGGDH